MRTLVAIAKRLGRAALLVLGVTVTSWVLVAVLPGDPARLLVGPQASNEDLAAVRRVYGLDQPRTTQLARYVTHLVHRAPAEGAATPGHTGCAEILPHVHLDLGLSHVYRQPVTRLVAKRLPVSLWLALGAFWVQLVLGGAAGLLAGARPGSRTDEAVVGSSLLFSTVPTFVVGLGLQYAFAYRLGVLPMDGWGRSAAEHAVSLVLPSLALGIYGAAGFARLVREEVRDALSRDHARTATAKGASRTRVVLAHGLRVALTPIATLAALDLGALVGGAIAVERIFGLPGLGDMTVNAVQNRDASLVVASVLVSSGAIVVGTLLADLAALMLDPRARRR